MTIYRITGVRESAPFLTEELEAYIETEADAVSIRDVLTTHGNVKTMRIEHDPVCPGVLSKLEAHVISPDQLPEKVYREWIHGEEVPIRVPKISAERTGGQ